MKKLLLYFGFSALLLVACDKTVENSRCLERPPENELCLAYFERWFYDKESQSCEKVAYSGCSEKGFETKAECEDCVKNH